jgi:peptidoglycan/LPS O-acetylase OafA/YrhL
MTEITTIPALAAIVYTIIDIAKTALGGDERFKRFIPLIACLLGAGCGVVAFYCVPGVMETENLLVALVLGAASGLSATGANQIGKQLTHTTTAEE